MALDMAIVPVNDYSNNFIECDRVARSHGKPTAGELHLYIFILADVT